MRAKLFFMIFGAGLLLASAPAWAHHSFAAEFDEKQPVTLKGTLTKMEWVNPHGWLHIDVKTPDGKVQSWAIEAGGPTALLRRGLRKTDFPIGIELTVQGYRAKNGSNTANGRTVTTTDGKNFFLGSSGGPGDGAEQRVAPAGAKPAAPAPGGGYSTAHCPCFRGRVLRPRIVLRLPPARTFLTQAPHDTLLTKG